MSPRERHAEAVRLYRDERLPLATVGARVGAHLSTVRLWLAAAGVERRPVGRPRRAA